GIEGAREILAQPEAQQHGDRRTKRHGDQKADEAEEITEREHGEDQPNRMQSHTLAHELGRDNVALDELTDQENGDDERDPLPVRPELRDRHADCDHQPGHRADIGNERDHAADETDEQREIQPPQHQSNREVKAEHEADADLPAQKTADRRVDLAAELTHGLALAYRYPAVHPVDHRMPISDQVKGHHRHHDQHRRE